MPLWGNLDAELEATDRVLVNAGDTVANLLDVGGEVLRFELCVLQPGMHHIDHFPVAGKFAFQVEDAEYITHHFPAFGFVLVRQQACQVVQAELDAADPAINIRRGVGIEFEQAIDGGLEKLLGITTGARNLVNQPGRLHNTRQGQCLFFKTVHAAASMTPPPRHCCPR